jgi:alcohol dehydrogenase class IV
LIVPVTAFLDPFDFTLPTRICFGAGRRSGLVEIIERERWRRIGVVVDHNLFPNPLVRDLLESLGETSDELVVEQCRIQEPTYDSLDQMRGAFVGRALDAVIGIGGGSALDMSKAMAVLATNPGPAISYRGFDRVTVPPLGIVAVPTTAGTGSEATPNASFIDSREKFKMGINGEAVRPRYAVLDPELTLSCPRSPTLSAGVDSLVHATEAFVARKSNPMARFFAREGFQLVSRHLPEVMSDPSDLAARSKVMYGAFLSGVALMHSGTGPAAALSYPLGVHYKVPHGIAGAVFLPHVVQFNVENGVYDYALLLGGNDSPEPAAVSAGRFVGRMFDTWEVLGVPSRLSDFGPGISSDLLVRDTLKLQPALDQNPVTFGDRQIRSVLSALGVT